MEGEPLAMIRQRAVYYFHNDQLGSPLKLTDNSQNVAWDGVRAPFGEMSVTTNAVENPLRFPGQYFDAETGLHHNYFRDYNPALGRYIQSDPIGLSDGPNTYVYVRNDPLKFYDPDGQAAQAVGGCIAGSWAGPVGCGVGATATTAATLLGISLMMTTDVPDDNTGQNAEECSDDEACEALYQSILKTCAGLTGESSLGVLRQLGLPEINAMKNGKSRHMPMKYVAERMLLFSEKGGQEKKEVTVKISEPFVATYEDIGFPANGIVSGCHVKIEGLNEPGFDLYGMDSLQAINLASDIEPLIKRLGAKYDFFWVTGEPYFEE